MASIAGSDAWAVRADGNFDIKQFEKIVSESCCEAIQYHHLGIAVSNFEKSLDFYHKIGLSLIEEKSNEVVKVLINQGGLEVHLFLCDQGIEDEKNILMDLPENKYPGHTHASFFVPNVAATGEYLISQGIALSGDRKRGDKLFAYFARDPDRTTWEFEKNHGEPDDVGITRESIGQFKRIDHIGIRTCHPAESFRFYAENLGFIFNVSTYEPAPEVLKNGRPWVSRSQSGIDINFIINGNERVAENILVANGCVRPGIIYAAYTVVNLDEAEARLRAAGVFIVHENDLAASKWACLALRTVLTGKSIFIEDGDLNIIRLVEAST